MLSKLNVDRYSNVIQNINDKYLFFRFNNEVFPYTQNLGKTFI